MAVAHSQSCTLGYVNLLSSRFRRASAQNPFAAKLGTSCILNPSLGVEGSQVPEESRQCECSPVAFALSPTLGGGEPLVRQQWLLGVANRMEH